MGMASAEPTTPVEVTTRIEASPEVVFDFFTDPDKMVQWMGRAAELEPLPGGRLRCDINGRDVARGEFVALEPPRRLVFSWGWEGESAATPPGLSTVEVLLEPDGEGTNLRLLHRDLPSAEVAAKHGEGWTHYLQRLATVASGGDPGADPWATPAETEQAG
jgi:uncharacterized protein YndB with AHSA1/START domain